MTDILPYNSSTHPIVKLADDWNNLLDHGLEKTASYIIRKNGSYYEAIQGGTSTGAGTIAFGGSGNAGSISGTDYGAVVNAALTAAGSTGKVVSKGNCTLTSTGIQITSPVTFEFEVITLNAPFTTQGIKISNVNGWEAKCGTVIQGKQIQVDAAGWSSSAVLIQNCSGVTVDVKGIVNVAQTGTGIEVYAANGEGVMGTTIRNIQLMSQFVNGIYLHTDGTGYINQNEIDNSWVSDCQYCLKLYNNGGGIGHNKFWNFVCNDPVLNSNHTAGSYSIWAETGAGKTYDYIEYNQFFCFQTWDPTTATFPTWKDYHADTSVKYTSFICGNPLVTQSGAAFWDDSGSNTYFFGNQGSYAAKAAVGGFSYTDAGQDTHVAYPFGYIPWVVVTFGAGGGATGEIRVYNQSVAGFNVTTGNSGTLHEWYFNWIAVPP